MLGWHTCVCVCVGFFLISPRPNSIHRTPPAALAPDSAWWRAGHIQLHGDGRQGPCRQRQLKTLIALRGQRLAPLLAPEKPVVTRKSEAKHVGVE